MTDESHTTAALQASDYRAKGAKVGWAMSLADLPDLAELMVELPAEFRDPIRSTIPSRELRQAFLDLNGGADWITHLPVPLERMDIDHVVPHVYGGGHDLSNFRPTDFVINRTRGDDLRILVDRKIGVRHGADGYLHPDMTGHFKLIEHNGQFFNVQRVTLDRAGTAGLYAAVAGAGFVAARQGWDWHKGRRDGIDFETLARAAASAGLGGVTANIIRTAILGHGPIATLVAAPAFAGAGAATAPAWVPVVVTIGASAVAAYAAATVTSVADEAWDQAATVLRTRDLEAFDLGDLRGAATRPAKSIYNVVRYPFRYKVRQRQHRWASVTLWRQTEETRALDALLEVIGDKQRLLPAA